MEYNIYSFLAEESPMKIWQLVSPKALKMNSFAPTGDALPGGAIKIKIEKVMLAADDALLYSGAVPVRYPFVPGCYAIGRISDVAKNVTDYKRSMRVALRSAALSDEGVIFFGRNKAGYMRDFITATNNDFYVIPSSVTDDEALFIGMLARADAVVEKLAAERGKIIAVMGGSLLAIMICQLLLRNKVIPIYIDYSASRRALARTNGIFYTLAPGEELFDSVYEITGGRLCDGGVYSFSGNTSTLNDLFRLTGFHASIVFTGESNRPVNLTSHDITRKDLTLSGVYSGYGHELSALNCIANKAVNLANYKRNTSSDSHLPEAYERLLNFAEGEDAFEIITF